MKKLAVYLAVIFILCPRYYAKEIIGSKEAEKIRIEPAQPLTVNIKMLIKKYFKIKGVKFELDNIKQDLSGQYVVNISNSKGSGEPFEEIRNKTWAVQEIVSHDTFEINRIEIKMGMPLEDNQELLVCDNDLFEKSRGIIKYDEEKKECFVLLDPTVQIQKDEHFFIAVKLAETQINVKTDQEERLSAFYTEYPDGFKERDPFPEYLKKELAASKKSLIYKFYSKEAPDLQPSFQIKVNDSFTSLWTWNGEEKAVIKDKNAIESIEMYFSENRNTFNEKDGAVLPLVFTPENSTRPIDLQLASWEMEIKTPEDFFIELKSAVETVFKNDEETKTNLVTRIKEIWERYKDESINEMKDEIKEFIQDVYLEEQQAQSIGSTNEIKGILALAEELKSMF